jgi:DNA modification methylase
VVKPYFENNSVTLYLGDCRDILPTLPKASVHLIVTDPPYGVKWRSNMRAERFDFIAWDGDADAAIAGLELAVPILANNRHIYVFGRYELGIPLLRSRVELIWDKQLHGAGDLTMPYGPQHEYIQFALVRRNRDGPTVHSGELAGRLRRGSILSFEKVNGAVMRHPTEKPVPLLRELIEMSSRIGETVLDPFAGVGSTLVAAQLEGRKSIGIELEEKYCAIAAERLAQSVMVFDDP